MNKLLFILEAFCDRLMWSWSFVWFVPNAQFLLLVITLSIPIDATSYQVVYSCLQAHIYVLLTLLCLQPNASFQIFLFQSSKYGYSYLLKFSYSGQEISFVCISLVVLGLFLQGLYLPFECDVIFLLKFCHFGEDEVHAISEGPVVGLIDLSTFIH